MFTRSRDDVEKVEWGGGTSERLLVDKDNMGFAVAHTVVRAGSSSKLQYRNHLEACYCIGGSGSVVEPDGTEHKITEGTIYVLDEHDAHTLKGGDNEDLILVSIFNPAITGNEKHELTEDGYSSY
ncbi:MULTISPECIES: ectoine synthase [Auritidibacter]|uniref:L-ectoine synthase n=1 Tax=Auritidibacter ignavus TaxID=678932 RepID=A0AAJ6AQ38_9MICC|nr:MULTISPECIES: ectoine synthase [Auritidibacter]PXA81190.1 L-ectoine synthase [Auritidibacter sp. NML120779]AXR73793.1 L-ectoine synthase [Auritidibacter sp. NML130574]NIH72298.1 L-ectoine synthase [Auritidibacter ignavus]PXA76086.1 L-ectoine synthase [Auritidibacter sp. NML100628]PXA78951.1 L-ectoine synthase [Auritidibacter sp. NML120636]